MSVIFADGDLAAVRISGVFVIARCPQDETSLYSAVLGNLF